MMFHTFRGYLEAICIWSSSLFPHADGLIAQVATAVNTAP